MLDGRKTLDSNLDPEKMGKQLDHAQNDAFNKDGVRLGGEFSRDTGNLPRTGVTRGCRMKLGKLLITSRLPFLGEL